MGRPRRSTRQTADSAPPQSRLEQFLARAAANDRAVQRRLAASEIWNGERWVSMYTAADRSAADPAAAREARIKQEHAERVKADRERDHELQLRNEAMNRERAAARERQRTNGDNDAA